jgi:hypothetical protein
MTVVVKTLRSTNYEHGTRKHLLESIVDRVTVITDLLSYHL